ncbi:MAG: hypothetical protein M1831_004941 [Alyxoria varia]|nr:MAG: hypothetical protein M1831_004941 [Alyxoria varia]
MPTATHSPFRFAVPSDHDQPQSTSRKPQTGFWTRRDPKTCNIRLSDDKTRPSSLNSQRKHDQDKEWRTGDAFSISRASKIGTRQELSETGRFGAQVESRYNAVHFQKPVQVTAGFQDLEKPPVPPSSDDDDMLDFEDDGTSPLLHFATTQEKDPDRHGVARKRRRLDSVSSGFKTTANGSARLGGSDSPTSLPDESQPPAGSSPTRFRSTRTLDHNHTPFKYPQPPSTFSPAPSTSTQSNRKPPFAITPSRQIPPLAPAPASSSKFLTYNHSVPSATPTQTKTQKARVTQFILPAASTSDSNGQTGATVQSDQARHTSSLLPSTFSPHNRKGQTRFVADGWASQVRGWILDASSEGHGPAVAGDGSSVPRASREEDRMEAARNVDGSVKAIVLDVLSNSEEANDLNGIQAAASVVDTGKEGTLPIFLRARLLSSHGSENRQCDGSENGTDCGSIDILITGQEKRKNPFGKAPQHHAQKGSLIGLGAPWWCLDVDAEGAKKTWLVCAGGWWFL